MTGEGGRVVLVVTDSSDALAVAETLEPPYDVRTARSTAAALETVERVETLDALVLAAYLPDRSGATLLETLRDRSVDARAGVLVESDEGEFPGFDLRVETTPTAEELERAVGRLVSLGVYDEQVDRLYELAKQQGRDGAEAAPVGDGGVESVDSALLDAREAADAALTDVCDDDRDRLFADETIRTGFGDEQR
jgi:CheY-like chemotaxis protein